MQAKNITIYDESIKEKINLSYFYSKGTEKVAIIIIHGMGAAKELYLEIFNYPEITKNDILIVDLVGYGNSSSPKKFTYSMKDQARILHKLLQKLSIKNDIILIAHSMGGPIAIFLAKLLKKQVKGIIYAEGNLDEGDCISSGLISSHTKEDWEKYEYNAFLTMIQSDPTLTEFANTFKKALPSTIYKSSKDLYKISKKDNLFTKLCQLSIPVLGIFGDKNKGKYTSEQKLSSKFPICFITNADHGMMNDNPNEFYNVVSDFLKQI